MKFLKCHIFTQLHADTLSQCYRQQIAEQETRHNREIIELQSRMEKTASPVETTVVPPTMTREEGEGSESIESNNPPKVGNKIYFWYCSETLST